MSLLPAVAASVMLVGASPTANANDGADALPQLVVLLNQQLQQQQWAVGPAHSRFYFELGAETADLHFVLAQQVQQHELLQQVERSQRSARFVQMYRYANQQSGGEYGEVMSAAMQQSLCMLPHTSKLLASGLGIELQYRTDADSNAPMMLIDRYGFSGC
ncbi:hypothetical protein [uncultured Ferrimonas sp.]|uniref:hypothetical protein n=1 Tax=uncultured Ferrimonas sp. TaxID=432640 RepID=UPI00262BEE49|nr:hypothetical protein [uncultured Ferrimonas sp.]